MIFSPVLFVSMCLWGGYEIDRFNDCGNVENDVSTKDPFSLKSLSNFVTIFGSHT